MSQTEPETKETGLPSWDFEASLDDRRPEWVEMIPRELWELGEVFFPIPRGEKGWKYPHHMNSYRHPADSEVLNAYFDVGWGYGVACANDLAVVDIDEIHVVDEVVEKLPETMWQKTGSRTGYHLFYRVPGLDSRITLNEQVGHNCDNPDHRCNDYRGGTCDKESDWDHIGEVKCDPHGYVVGPGSVHPSGNKYGPLRGDKIATVEKEELEELLDDFVKPGPDTDHYRYGDGLSPDKDTDEIHTFYTITADEVLPGLNPGNRIAHPVHGSTTYDQTNGASGNFMKNEDGETFTCWRCQYGTGDGCGLNGAQFLACEATGLDCEDVRAYWTNDTTMHYKAWRLAVSKGLVDRRDVPYKALHGYAVRNGVIDNKDKLSGSTYWQEAKCLEWDMMMDNILGRL